MQQTTARRWEDYEGECRTAWERAFPNVAWNEVNDGFRYGWEQAHDPRYSSHEWLMVENDLRSGWSDWEIRFGKCLMAYQLDRDWESLRLCVRYGWERGKQEANSATIA